MFTREDLLRSAEFWIGTLQNQIYNFILNKKEAEGLTQKELAKKLGLSKGRISQIINDDNLNMTMSKFVKLCLALGYVPNYNFEKLDDFIKRDKIEELGAVGHNESKHVNIKLMFNQTFTYKSETNIMKNYRKEAKYAIPFSQN